MFSAFYFFSFFYTALTWTFVLMSLGYYTVFVLLYFQLVDGRSRYLLVQIAAVALLGIVASGTNSSASMFFGYATFFCGYYLPRRIALLLSLLIIACLLFSAAIHKLWVSYYIFPGLVPAVAMGFLGAFIQQGNAHQRREQQSAEEKRILAAAVERERIARDLHDTLGHTLSSIALKAQLARKLGERGDQQGALREIDQVAVIASETLSQVRSVISGYKARDLKAQLQQLQSRLEDAGFSTRINNATGQLPARLEAALVLILTEAVTNMLRHSRGKQATIELKHLQNRLEIVVADDGSIDTYTPGNGISGIDERLQELGGELQISINNGFQLHMTLPETAE